MSDTPRTDKEILRAMDACPDCMVVDADFAKELERENARLLEAAQACSPKIVQLILTPNDAMWQGRLLGLGDDGVTYEVGGKNRWTAVVPPLRYEPTDTTERNEAHL